MSKKNLYYKYLAFILFTIAWILFFSLLKPYAQPLSYHSFADQRMYLKIPNFWNVVSNFPRDLISIYALWMLFSPSQSKKFEFATIYEKGYYLVFFLGLFSLGFTSSYYHWNPNNDTLVGDRLSIAVTFMAIFSAIISERLSSKLALILFIPLQILGIFSVLHWHHTEVIGQGDLRLYLFVQIYAFFAMAILILLFKPTYTLGKMLWGAFILYFLAKIFEIIDQSFFDFTQGVFSGHPLKHIFTAFAALFIYFYIRYRKQIIA